MLDSDASFYQTITRYILNKYNLKSEVYKNVSIPIIGTGGVTHWQDAVQMILAGASLVSLMNSGLISQANPP